MGGRNAETDQPLLNLRGEQLIGAHRDAGRADPRRPRPHPSSATRCGGCQAPTCRPARGARTGHGRHRSGTDRRGDLRLIIRPMIVSERAFREHRPDRLSGRADPQQIVQMHEADRRPSSTTIRLVIDRGIDRLQRGGDERFGPDRSSAPSSSPLPRVIARRLLPRWRLMSPSVMTPSSAPSARLPRRRSRNPCAKSRGWPRACRCRGGRAAVRRRCA